MPVSGTRSPLTEAAPPVPCVVMVRIAPSLLSADFACLGRDIDRVAPETDLLHVDVMDGHFVPNLTIGPPVVAAIRRHTDAFLDCHLMISNPGDYLEAFQAAGADHCTVHIEVGDTGGLIEQMRSLGLDVGLAVNPETPFEAVEAWLARIDLLLVMSVHPGFGGQRFIPEVVDKIRRGRRAATDNGLDLHIEVDGGIDVETVPATAEAGADTFVAGSAIFDADEPVAAAGAIRAAAVRATAARAAEQP